MTVLHQLQTNVIRTTQMNFDVTGSTIHQIALIVFTTGIVVMLEVWVTQVRTILKIIKTPKLFTQSVNI